VPVLDQKSELPCICVLRVQCGIFFLILLTVDNKKQLEQLVGEFIFNVLFVDRA